jgi:hypothetical protein
MIREGSVSGGSGITDPFEQVDEFNRTLGRPWPFPHAVNGVRECFDHASVRVSRVDLEVLGDRLGCVRVRPPDQVIPFVTARERCVGENESTGRADELCALNFIFDE